MIFPHNLDWRNSSLVFRLGLLTERRRWVFIGVMFDPADGVGGSVLFIGVAIDLFVIDTDESFFCFDFKDTYLTLKLPCSWNFFFICLEKASARYLWATQAQKLLTYRPFTNTLPQKSTYCPLTKFKKPPILILFLSTLST